jgi:hypothetical protein
LLSFVINCWQLKTNWRLFFVQAVQCVQASVQAPVQAQSGAKTPIYAP